MPQWPADLKPNQKIGFGWADMPNQVQNLTDYRDAATSGAPGGVIFLPLPAQIQDSLNHTWNKTKSISTKMIETGASEVKAFLSSTPAGSKAMDIVSSYSDATGIHLDPNFFYTYQYTDPRTFNYSINMIPKNAQEAIQIADIIKKFKAYSSPKKGGTFVKNYKWGIEVGNPLMKDALKFEKNPWALTSVSVNYTGAGSALFFEDGNPKQVNLSLTFQEMQTMHDVDFL